MFEANYYKEMCNHVARNCLVGVYVERARTETGDVSEMELKQTVQILY